jgi:hypothetical protein
MYVPSPSVLFYPETPNDDMGDSNLARDIFILWECYRGYSWLTRCQVRCATHISRLRSFYFQNHDHRFLKKIQIYQPSSLFWRRLAQRETVDLFWLVRHQNLHGRFAKC